MKKITLLFSFLVILFTSCGSSPLSKAKQANEAIIEAAKNMKSKVGESIVENQELGRHCYEMAQIQTNVELPFTIQDIIYPKPQIPMTFFHHKLNLKRIK